MSFGHRILKKMKLYSLLAWKTDLPINTQAFLQKLLSGTKIPLTESFELRIILLNILRRVVGNVLM